MEARCDRFTFWWFYLVKAAREECHCTSFEKTIQYLGDISLPNRSNLFTPPPKGYETSHDEEK